MPLRAIFLDVGNTLLTEASSRYAIYAGAAQRRGVEIDAASMRHRMGSAHHALGEWLGDNYRYSDPWFEAFIARIFGEENGLGFAPEEVSAITQELFDTFESPETFRLFPGAHALLATLREANLQLGVISNWSERLDRVLAGTGLGDAFDFVLCSAIEGMEKPDAALFERALERAGVEPHEALHAGDHPVLDVAGARAAGLHAVLVDHAGGVDREESERVTSLEELSAYILERTR